MKNKIILLAILILSVPALTAIILLLTGVRTNNVDTKNGESYMAALDKVNVNDIEQEIRNQHTLAIDETEEPTEPKTEEPKTEEPTEPKTEEPTEPKTEETTDAPTEAPVIPSNPVQPVTPVSLISEAGYAYSAIGSYNPYTFDEAKAQATAASLADGSLDYREVFATSVFVGDSVMDGFDVYMHMPHTYTEVGATLSKHLPSVIDKVISNYPDYIFIRYGVNEMDVTDEAATNFANKFKEYIKKLKANLPNTKIFVLGLTPVGPTALGKSQRFGNVAVYNAKIKTFCMELGVGFYENSYLFLEHTYLYSKDGIHIGHELYKIWLRDMVTGLGIY